MATVDNKIWIEYRATLTLNESELRAFDALVGYGDDGFLKAFKTLLGEAYISNHEAGLRSAFAAIRKSVLPALHDIDTVRKDLKEAAKKRTDKEIPF